MSMKNLVIDYKTLSFYKNLEYNIIYNIIYINNNQKIN